MGLPWRGVRARPDKLLVFRSQFAVPRSPFPLVLRSVKKHRWTFAVLSFIALSENLSLFSSLGGAYFLIVTDPQSHQSKVDVTVSGKVGNNTANLSNIYTPFVSAAGVSPLTR